MPRCRACDAAIAWRQTTSGKRIPLDLETLWVLPGELPDGEKRCVVVTGDGRTVWGAQVSADTPAAVRGQVSHWATCPDASRWRSR